MFGSPSKPIAASPIIAALLSHDLYYVSGPSQCAGLSGVVGWGEKPSGKRAQELAKRHSAASLLLEDGFLRSYGTGEHFPPLSLVVDDLGIYYDASRPSRLECLLASDADLLAGIAGEVGRARELILRHRLSKYNHAPMLDSRCLDMNGRRRVLVVDQTVGDLSVSLGSAGEQTFHRMLEAAYAENPDATVYVKTHPEVASGRKRGYLAGLDDDERTVVLRQAVNPLSLIEHMDRVYVVTSIMGFEALLAGKPVSVFGLPWYAGWGVTDDRQTCRRRSRPRDIDELFAAAYVHYTRYLNPETHARGDIFDVIRWLIRQRRVEQRISGRLVAVGYRRWKAATLKPLLTLQPERATFVRDADQAAMSELDASDALVAWGRDAPPGIVQLAGQTGARRLRMEDGFVRSVGLGSDMIPPLSIVLDERGIYFDPTQPSDLEHLLGSSSFTEDDLARARRIRDLVVRHGITKYNLESREPVNWATGGREVVLVPGQVEDDASIRYGAGAVNTNLGLLQAAREAHPKAFIVYKPHPDVTTGNRLGSVALAEARRWADHIETTRSVVSCLEASDVVHTMTSLTGFDALLRIKRVVTYGEPFYAGWGLTTDRASNGKALARRRRRLSLDELVAGALIRYPYYWDPDLRGYTTCEAVLHRIAATRDALEEEGKLYRLHVGYLGRQLRKLKLVTKLR